MFEVLIVDDIEITRIELKRLKIWGEKTGFIIIDEAKDGKEAIKKLEKRPVDLVITDIRMPGIDGINLLKKIISENLSSCVVFLSEYAEFEYARQGLIYGAFDYIVKPVDCDKMEELLRKVEKHLSEKKFEKKKLEKLEAEFGKKVENFYIDEDIEKLVKLFKDVELNVVGTASSMIEAIGVAVDYEPMKMAYILSRMLTDLIEELKQVYPWLDKFINISDYARTDFTRYSNFLESKNVFLEVIRELIMKVKKFEFGDHLGSMIRQVCKVVLDNTDCEISVKSIAEELFLNHSYLSTLFKEKTGSSLVEYITMIKMERAKAIFMTSDLKNYEIADRLGYKDVEYFSKVFKKYTGETPSSFKCSVTSKPSNRKEAIGNSAKCMSDISQNLAGSKI